MADFEALVDGIAMDYKTGHMKVSFELLTPIADELARELNSNDTLIIKVSKKRNRRSLNANALLWECLGQMAIVLRTDKWDVYLRMLRRYGKYTYVCVKPSAVDAVRRQWRESEVLGDITINGRPAVQMLYYFGSSTYNSKEFSVLLDGVISEMEDMGLQPPLPADVQAAIEMHEKENR
jgi:hypothetical protein